MSQKTELSNRLKEIILNGTWIANTNYKHQLDTTSWEKAVEKLPNFNSIAMLTFHIQYYISGILHYFETGNLEIKDQYSFDLPNISTKEDWKNLKNQLYQNTEKLATIIENLTKKELQNIFVKPEYGTVQRNIDAMIEHSYYHLGQIVILKKMLEI